MDAAGAKYVRFDPETARIVVELPPDLAAWKTKLQFELAEVFWGEPENGQTAERMERFVQNWLQERGIAGNPKPDDSNTPS